MAGPSTSSANASLTTLLAGWHPTLEDVTGSATYQGSTDYGMRSLRQPPSGCELWPAVAAAPCAAAVPVRLATVQAVQFGAPQQQRLSPFSLPACQEPVQQACAPAAERDSPLTWLAGWGKLAESMGCAASLVESNSARALLRHAVSALPSASSEQAAYSGGTSCTVGSSSPRRSAECRADPPRPPPAAPRAPAGRRQHHSIDLGAAGAGTWAQPALLPLPPRACSPAMAPPPPHVTLSSADWDEMLPEELLVDASGELEAVLAAAMELPGPGLPRPHSH